MARTAEQSIVLEPAFAAAVRDGDDVIGFPSWTKGAPGAARGAIAGGRLRSRPLAVGFHDVTAAELAGALVALLDLLTDVPRAASDLPLMHARVAAECAARRLHRAATPAADRLAGVVAIRLAPLVGAYDARATGAHALEYRRVGRGALEWMERRGRSEPRALTERTEITGKINTEARGRGEDNSLAQRKKTIRRQAHTPQPTA